MTKEWKYSLTIDGYKTYVFDSKQELENWIAQRTENSIDREDY